MNVVLTEAASELDEVVVVGYGTVKNKLGAVEIGIPSTTYNGSLPALIERVPRIRIDGAW